MGTITFISTRVEFSHGKHLYQATRKIDGEWYLNRWLADKPKIPPMMESLYVDGWQQSFIATTEERRSFTHLDGLEEFVDPPRH